MAAPYVTGRPTKYKQDTNVLARGYIESCGENHVVSERPVIKDGKVDEEQYVKKQIKLPTFEGLSILLNVHRDTLYAWAKENPEFSDTLDLLKKKQAEMLIQNGLSGDYNQTIAKLILSANHGMNEKTESESKVTVEMMDAEKKKQVEDALSELV